MKKAESICARYRSLIASGALGGGEKLPSVREEAAASGVSINTVVGAYARLEDEGWIRARSRGGFYARPPRRIAAAAPVPADRYVAEARSAGERLDQVFERLARLDQSFAVAAPGPDLLPADRLERAFAHLPREWVSYADSAGAPELRRRIALASAAADGTVGGAPDGSDVVVANGATEALSLVFRALLSPGDEVVLEAPTYFAYFRQLAPLGVRIVEIPVGDGGIDLDLLERELAARPIKAILVQPNVQNPTGATMDDAAKARLLELARRSGAILIQDDVYGDLHYGPRRPRNLESFGDYDRLVTVSSCSKTIAPGLRIGWAKSARYAARLTEEKLRTSYDTCRPAQFAVADFLGTSAHRKHLAALRSALEARVDAHLDLLSRVLPPLSAVRRPSGGCLLWIALPPGTDGTAVFERAAGKGLIAAPGELFSANPFFSNYLRINAGWELGAERREALAALGDAI